MADSVGGSVIWNLDVDPSKFESGLIKAKVQAESFGGQLNKVDFKGFAAEAGSAFSGIADGLSRLIKGVAIAGVAGSVGFGAMAKAAFNQVSQVEQATVALNAYEKDSSKVNKVLKELIGFARSDLGVLFQRQDLFAAAQGLRIMGDSTEDLTNHVKIMARSVGLGLSNFQGLGNVIQRVGSTQKLYADDLQFLQNAGFKLDSSLSGTHQTFDSLFKLLDKGIPADAMAGQSKTINGQMVKLQTSFRDLGGAILGVDKDTSTFIKGGLGDQFITLLKDLRTQLASPEVKKAFGEFGKQVASFAETVLPKLISGFTFVAKNIDTLLPILGALVAMFVAAKAAAIVLAIQGGIAMGTISFPILAIAAAITVVVGILAFLQLKFNIFGKALKLLEPVLNIVKGVFKDLWESVKKLAGVIAKELAPVFEFVSKHAETFKKIGLVILGIVLAPLIAIVGIVIGAIKLLAIVLGFIADHFQTIKKIILIVLAVVFAPFIAIIALIILIIKNFGKIMGVLGDIFSKIGKVIGDVVKTIGNIIANVFNGIVAVVTWVFTTIWKIISPILNFIKNLFIIVFGGILLVILTVLNFIKNIIVNAFNFWWGVISTVLGFIWDKITTVWNAIWSTITTVIGWIWDRLVNAFYFYKDLIINVFTDVWNFISDIWNKIYGVISGVVQSIIDFFAPAASWLFDKGKAIVQGLIDGVKNLAGDVWGAIKFVADKIGAFFSGAWDWLYNVGRDIVQGLINGLKSMVGAVSNAASDVGNAVKDKVKNLLGIRSPSKVFYGFGQNITQGLINGIDNGMSKVENVASQLSMSTTAPSVTSKGETFNNGESQINNFSVKVDVSGIMASSRSAMRDVGVDLVESINEGLRAKGLPEIGGGNIMGVKTNG